MSNLTIFKTPKVCKKWLYGRTRKDHFKILRKKYDCSSECLVNVYAYGEVRMSHYFKKSMWKLLCRTIFFVILERIEYYGRAIKLVVLKNHRKEIKLKYFYFCLNRIPHCSMTSQSEFRLVLCLFCTLHQFE